MSNNLLFLDPVDDDAQLPAGALTWGTVVRRSSADLSFRVYNNTTDYTAVGVAVSLIDTGSTASPSVAAQHLLSLDGQSFTATINVGDLPPFATSGRLYLRRVTASNAQLGAFTFRLLATPTAWS